MSETKLKQTKVAVTKTTKAPAKKEKKPVVVDSYDTSTYAILNLGGKQQMVRPGDQIYVELMEGQKGSALVLDQVLLRKHNDQIEVGRPYVANATVKAVVIGEAKGDKLIVFHKIRRKHHRKKVGHRQH